MYRKSSKGWLKHWDFILLDMLCLQAAFLLAYICRHGLSNPYAVPIYRQEAIAYIIIQIVVTFFAENFKGVLRRGYYKEFVATVNQVIFVALFSAFYLFMIQEGKTYSRMTLVLTGVFYLMFSYPVRVLWKKKLLNGGLIANRSLLIVTVEDRAKEVIESIRQNNYMGVKICGLGLMDADKKGKSIAGIWVVADRQTLVEYVRREWIDGIFIDLPDETKLQPEIMEAFNKMGVTVHLRMNSDSVTEGRKQQVERFGGYTVLTSSENIVSSKELFYKRILDFFGAVVGCILTGILCLVVASAIYIKSPGPIFFTQVRVGRNGKKFKMYKFRSMYMDAEERKQELMRENRIKDGLMFKMEDDPRIIKGIGHFIRKTSIDEFPQFFNVLKGDMSLVGTRPPTVDEWEKYDLHHRVRLAIKPGITGLWQVSGRSSITDFEEVVKLDKKYIEEWSIGKDLKILLKTVGVVFGSDGAM